MQTSKIPVQKRSLPHSTIYVHNAGGSYYTSFDWFEALSCCVANHGYLAELTSEEEHNLIKERLTLSK